LLNALADSGYFNAIVHGHSHLKGIQLRGKTLLVNPGEVCGYLSGKATIATIDTEKHEAKIIEL
jgi:putative phosphoesterase